MHAGDMPVSGNAAVLFADEEPGVFTAIKRMLIDESWDNKEFLAVRHPTLQQVGR